MIYKIIILPLAESDIDLAYRYIAQCSVRHADRWFNGLYDAIMSLRTMPQRYGLAREAISLSRPVRQLIYGRRTQAYRVLYIVQKRRLLVLRVLYGARDQLDAGELTFE